MAAEAAHVHLDAPPGDQAVGLDAELAIDVHRPAPVGLQEFEKPLSESRVVAGIAGAASAVAGTAVDV